MKKYKLIKTYPGSTLLGTIGYFEDTILVIEKPGGGSVKTASTDKSILDTFKWSEFWEEIVEKDYEILSFIHNGEHQVKIDTIIKIKNGFLDSTSQKLPLEHYLNAKCWNINSVKRLSDGEVFTVGDVVDERLSNYKSHTISKFRIHFNELCIYSVKGSLNVNLQLCFLNKLKQPLFTTEDGKDVYENDFVFETINDEKYFKVSFTKNSIMTGKNSRKYFSTEKLAQDYINSTKVLFCTEDGVDIFEGDLVYRVNRAGFFIFGNGSGEKMIGKGHDSWIPYSTKETAEEYILMNKPCLSLGEVLNINGRTNRIAFKQELKKLVKKLVKNKFTK